MTPRSYPSVPRSFPTYPKDVAGCRWEQTILSIGFHTDEAVALNLLPAGSELRPVVYARPRGATMYAYFADLTWTVDSPAGPWTRRHREAGLLVLCCLAPGAPAKRVVTAGDIEALRLREGVFCPLRYLDSCDAIVTGREIYGLPGKVAAITLGRPVRGEMVEEVTGEVDEVAAVVSVRDTPVLWARLDGLATARPRARPNAPWWVEKLTPDALGTGSQVHELVELTWNRTAPRKFRTGTARLDLKNGGAFDDLSGIPVHHTFDGCHYHDEFDLETEGVRVTKLPHIP